MSGADIRVAPLGASEREVLREWLADASARGADTEDIDSVSRVYDAYLQEVLAADPDDREDPTAVCTMVGLAMGEHIVRRSALQWRVVTDDEGTDLALSTPAEDAVLFPVDPVSEAWAEQRAGWLAPWVREFLDGVNQAYA